MAHQDKKASSSIHNLLGRHEFCYNRGVQLSQLNLYEEAIANYDKAIKLKPDYYEAWYDRGWALYILGPNEKALASYDKVIELKPDYYRGWYCRGLVLHTLGRAEEAIASYGKAIGRCIIGGGIQRFCNAVSRV